MPGYPHSNSSPSARTSWLAITPTALILALVLALTAAATQAATPAQAQSPTCVSCHAEEGADWEGSIHAKTEVAVDCEACHGPFKEGHPKAETMQLPMASTTCRTCHEALFDGWEESAHATKGIDCFDCHRSHTQGLRLESAEKLCAACHSDQRTQMAHSLHGIAGVACASCHMSPMKPTPEGTSAASDHTFGVASDVCVRCHQDSAHAPTRGGTEVSLEVEQESEANSLARISELESQVNEQQKRLTDLRNLSVMAMGLSLGVGGAIGLAIGIGATTFWGRRKANDRQA